MADGAASQGILEYPIMDEQSTSMQYISDNFDELIVAIGDNATRLHKSKTFLQSGITLATLLHPSAVISRFAQIGPGTVVLANAVVNPFAAIGDACIVNTSSVVEHDCILCDGVHISPKAALGGRVVIGEKSWICIGSTVANNLNIGANTIIGAGAVVLQDVPNDVLAAGVPATIRKRYK